MNSSSAFYCALKRRAQYEVKRNGGYFHYAHYRLAIADDCNRRCVYCDCHEDEVGGYESMVLDHFRPYGRTEFSHLRDSPGNLVHSCSRCNCYKSDHWPSENPDVCYNAQNGWIDPFEEVRAEFFELEADGKLSPRKAPAEYMIRLLRLNRELLQRLRQKRLLLDKLPELIEKLEGRWKAVAAGQLEGDAERDARDARLLLTLVKALQNSGKCHDSSS